MDHEPERSADLVGSTQYETYMRLGELLDLQRRPDEWVHRDELLFQVVHQTTELLLKLACEELTTGTTSLTEGAVDRAARLVTRAAQDIVVVTALLEVLNQLSPAEFHRVRPVLGTGSGAESPGWRSVVGLSADLWAAFRGACPGDNDVRTLLLASRDVPLYRLAEAMIEWDQRIGLWRARHYEVAARIVGEGVVGTAGTPVAVIRKRIHQRLFPELWAVRTTLTSSQRSDA